MKKIAFLIATLLIGGMILAGCHKNPQPTPEPEPGPEPDPTPTTATIVYRIDNTCINNSGQVVFVVSPCFHASFTYLDANGNPVSVENATLPWTQSFTAELPFTATIDGNFTYEESELPDTVYFGKLTTVSIGGKSKITDSRYTYNSKEKFLDKVNSYPRLLSLKSTLTVE